MPNTEAIRELNDQFRTRLVGGRLMLTAGTAGRPDTADILKRVVTFDTFSTDNDPHGEHDFGSFEHGDDTIIWKIDYYDKDLQRGSPDPSDIAVTTRVLTIMLAEEY